MNDVTLQAFPTGRAGLTSTTETGRARNLAANFERYLSQNTEAAVSVEAKDKPLMEAARQMEALFIKMMFKSMKATVHKTGLINGGQAEEIFDDMLTDEYATRFSQTGSFDLAKTIYEQYSSAARAGRVDISQ